MADDLTYVYVVGDLGLSADADLVGLPGVGEGPVRAVSAGQLAALVSSVDAETFGEEALKENLERLPWLEATARAHHAVVDAASRRYPVVPLRMATIYIADHSVHDMLERNAARFGDALDRIRGGRTEWGVKAYLTSAPSESVPEVSEGTGPGTHYLARRRATRDRTDDWREAAVRAIDDLHRRLSDAAVASRVHAPQDPRLTGRRSEMMLNAAYLVEPQGTASFQRTVLEWSDRHLQLELTGPWAPYSFAALDDEP
ncbi:MAG TPA: GvpL/GvpF family gas vesicle protein [Euzebyales bacterium]|nr:GvpL/GvpF family gas vesicle protein [Euzebyales bacterium]